MDDSDNSYRMVDIRLAAAMVLLERLGYDQEEYLKEVVRITKEVDERLARSLALPPLNTVYPERKV